MTLLVLALFLADSITSDTGLESRCGGDSDPRFLEFGLTVLARDALPEGVGVRSRSGDERPVGVRSLNDDAFRESCGLGNSCDRADSLPEFGVLRMIFSWLVLREETSRVDTSVMKSLLYGLAGTERLYLVPAPSKP